MVKRYALIILCITMIISVGGVFATWMYAEGSPLEQDKEVGLSLSVFEYPPEEILPGGDSTGEVELGQNHFATIDLIVYTATKVYNMNDSKSPFPRLLDQYGIIYCNQKTGGANLKFVLEPLHNNHNLYYCMEKISDTLYRVYTFSLDDLSTASGTDHEILGYRADIKNDGNEWKPTVSYEGYAKTAHLTDLGAEPLSQGNRYNIRVDTWHM